jgi:hypothetical protein
MKNKLEKLGFSIDVFGYTYEYNHGDFTFRLFPDTMNLWLNDEILIRDANMKQLEYLIKALRS